MAVSVIIPSQDPEAGFFSKIRSLLRDRPDWEVIIIDDASRVDISSFFTPSPNLKIVRNEAPLGAGASRNTGIKSIEREFTVFLDDDDTMHWNVVDEIVNNLRLHPTADFSISSYNILLNGKITHPWTRDQKILNYILGSQKERLVTLEDGERLLLFTSFPWNKVYRSDFLRRSQIRFSETAVQNDIFSHWQSILQANRILVTDSIQCTKVQNAAAARISNTSDHRRLEAFTALRETYDLVRSSDNPNAEAYFWSFYADIVKWMLLRSQGPAQQVLMHEHITFAAAMPYHLKSIEDITGTKRWEIWNMNVSLNLAEESAKQHPLLTRAEWDTCLSELSRMNRLSAELRDENDKLRTDRDTKAKHAREKERKNSEEIKNLRDIVKKNAIELDRMRSENTNLRRHLNSKATRVAFGLRSLYRKVIPINPRTER